MACWHVKEKNSVAALSGGAVRLILFALIFSGVIATFFSGGRRVHAQAKPQAQVKAQPAGQSKAQPATPQVAAVEDAQGRTGAILDHLNVVLRFYRDSVAPIQKVGEPSDLLYREQAVILSTQIAQFAFQSAKAEAALTVSAPQGEQAPATGETQSQRLQTVRKNVEQQIAQLKVRDAALEQQLQTAKPREVAALQEQREQVQGELGLQAAEGDALAKIIGTTGAAGEGGFTAQIEQLERSAPGLTDSKLKTAPPNLDNLNAEQSSGVTSQATVLFQLLRARQDIDNLVREVDGLKQQVTDLRAPLLATLRSTIAQGQALSQQAAVPAPAGGSSSAAKSAAAASAATTLVATKKSFDELTATFKGLSSAAVPLSQETSALEESRASLLAWRAAVNTEYTSILRWLLLRVITIAVALAVIFILGEVWRRATTRYVRDIRRRRQLLVVRRLAVGFLSGLVMIFGLVTQFSSLATFAGFITAGLAVGLQTILLSVAAYFFIIGRYGVRVGDRITIAGVSGDVIEVGLVRFYMMEMAGSGTDLYPTGRVAVFSNAVLFQAGTPLYKQMPGTEYIWHELTVKLLADADYRAAVQDLLKTVQKVYEGYKEQIERQHKHLESWIDSSIDMPAIQSNLQLVDGGLQLWARYPVAISEAASIDGKMVEALLQSISGNQSIKAAVSGPPVIKATVRG